MNALLYVKLNIIQISNTREPMRAHQMRPALVKCVNDIKDKTNNFSYITSS